MWNGGHPAGHSLFSWLVAYGALPFSHRAYMRNDEVDPKRFSVQLARLFNSGFTSMLTCKPAWNLDPCHSPPSSRRNRLDLREERLLNNETFRLVVPVLSSPHRARYPPLVLLVMTSPVGVFTIPLPSRSNYNRGLAAILSY